MSYLKWSDSKHWNQPATITLINEPLRPQTKTRREIQDAIRDNPSFNTMNPSNLAHIMDIAINQAKKNGTLKEEGDTE